jgi:hypothetical protein
VFALYEHDLPGQRQIALANDRLVTECTARAGLPYESAIQATGGIEEPDPQQPFGPENLGQLAPVAEPAPSGRSRGTTGTSGPCTARPIGASPCEAPG